MRRGPLLGGAAICRVDPSGGRKLSGLLCCGMRRTSKGGNALLIIQQTIEIPGENQEGMVI